MISIVVNNNSSNIGEFAEGVKCPHIKIQILGFLCLVETAGVLFLRNFAPPSAEAKFLLQSLGSQKSKAVCFFAIPFNSRFRKEMRKIKLPQGQFYFGIFLEMAGVEPASRSFCANNATGVAGLKENAELKTRQMFRVCDW